MQSQATVKAVIGDSKAVPHPKTTTEKVEVRKMWEQAHKNRGTDVKNKLLGKGNNPIRITQRRVKNLKEKESNFN